MILKEEAEVLGAAPPGGGRQWFWEEVQLHLILMKLLEKFKSIIKKFLPGGSKSGEVNQLF